MAGALMKKGGPEPAFWFRSSSGVQKVAVALNVYRRPITS